MKKLLFLLSTIFVIDLSVAGEIRTNAVHMKDAPKWLKRTRMEKVIDRIQYKLEWSTRRIEAHWYANQADFEKVHGLGAKAVAVTKNSKRGSSIHLGPKINDKNFDYQFGHEMVHVIIFQKYRGAIPKWLEEGLANHLSKTKEVDYKWLANHPFPEDVRSLAHPFGGDKKKIIYRYKASQALAEMLDKKCDLENLIRLSVQRKMEDYIRTYCEIKDLNKAFRSWVKEKAGSKKSDS